ncbi:hypothetical protein [Streptomyces violascens]|uniref:hypothetical protein n=1 Tax=Streptomyces violascens TaxID=67381 RepID=UPI003656A2E9
MDADQDLRSTVDALMDGLRADLERLARIPSIAFPGFPPEPVRQVHDLVVGLLRGALVPYVRAKLNLRVHRQQDPGEAQGALVAHVEALRPLGIPLTVTPGDAGPGFEPASGGPAYRAALTALREGWGAEPGFAASVGPIPPVNGLAKAAPGAVIAEAASQREYAEAFGGAS